jgi:hypothetical protein
MTNEDVPIDPHGPIDQPSRLYPHVPLDPPSRSEQNTGVVPGGGQHDVSSDRNTGTGGNEGSSGIQWPPAGDSFWSWPDDLKIEWLQDREAEKRFDQGVDRYIQETCRGGPEFPELIKEAIAGLAWKLLDDGKAYGLLRDGNREVAEYYAEQAHTIIRQLKTDYENYKPGDPMGRQVDNLGPKNDHRPLKDLWVSPPRRPAEAPRPLVPAREDPRNIDQFIADVVNPKLSDDEAYGRRYRSYR